MIHFKKILILTKTNLNLKEEILNKIKECLKESHIEFIEFEKFKKMHLDGRDLVITIGGDGTFVKAGNLIENSYILGINATHDKSEGALCSLKIEDLDKLSEIIKGEFNVFLMQRAQTKLNGKVLDELAINEVYVGSSYQFHTSRYRIRYKNKEEEQRSSGVIIATGIGSPAWFHSAGGKIFPAEEEKLSFVIREPYFGERIFKQTILEGDIPKGEKLTLLSERDFGGIVAINDSTYDFNRGDIAEIELSNKPLKVIKLK